MKVVVDTNIVFSAILNTQSRIGQLILLGSSCFEYFSTQLLKEEINQHQEKILQISQFSYEQYSTISSLILSRIRFVDEILLSDEVLREALDLTTDIDEDDTLFVALAKHLSAQLWTGDRKLYSGLLGKGFDQVISTDDLYRAFLKQTRK